MQYSAIKKAGKDRLLKWSLPLIILLVIGFQFYQVYFNNLSRWKGGGFGMYSQIHPLDKRVWIVSRDSSWIISGKKTKLEKAANSIRFFPHPKAMHRLANLVADTYGLDTFSIQIWEPLLTPKNNTLRKKKTVHVSYPK